MLSRLFFLIIALMYNGVNGIIGKARGYHDPINSVVAGAITGAVFKSTGKYSQPLCWNALF
jgi:hypothetical protein